MKAVPQERGQIAAPVAPVLETGRGSGDKGRQGQHVVRTLGLQNLIWTPRRLRRGESSDQGTRDEAGRAPCPLSPQASLSGL